MTTEPTDTVTIRRATPADAGTVHQLVLEIAALEGDLHHVHVTPERWSDLLRRDDVVVLLAERGGTPLGHISATRRLHLWTGGDLLAVDDVYVRPGERSGGLGRRLLATMARYAARDGLVVTWGAEPDNTRAQDFHRRLGATLRPKLLAGWAPSAYLPVVAELEEVAR